MSIDKKALFWNCDLSQDEKYFSTLIAPFKLLCIMRQTNGNFLVWTSMTMGGCSQNHKCCHLTMKPQASCDSTCYMDTVGLLMFTVLTESLSSDIKNWSTGIRTSKAGKLQKAT